MENLKSLIQANTGKTFIIELNDGTKVENRMFISANDKICVFKSRSRTLGYPISLSNVKDIYLKNQNEEIELCRRNLKNIVKYLTASGLWQKQLNGVKYLLSLSDNELKALAYDYNNVFNDELKAQGIDFFGMDCFCDLFGKKIKTINWEAYEKEYQTNNISKAINDKINYHYQWRKNYDNRIELNFDNNEPRGWYSEEYKGCGNGYYYYLLDEKHVLFGEKD